MAAIGATNCTFIESGALKFLISDSPTDSNLPVRFAFFVRVRSCTQPLTFCFVQSYLKEMQKHKVSHLVRVCDASYDVTRVAKDGIEVKDWPFVDGDAPPDAIITQWLDLVTRMSEGKGVRP